MPPHGLFEIKSGSCGGPHWNWREGTGPEAWRTRRKYSKCLPLPPHTRPAKCHLWWFIVWMMCNKDYSLSACLLSLTCFMNHVLGESKRSNLYYTSFKTMNHHRWHLWWITCFVHNVYGEYKTFSTSSLFNASNCNFYKTTHNMQHW